MPWASTDCTPAQFNMNLVWSITNAKFMNDQHIVISGIKKSDGTNFDATAMTTARASAALQSPNQASSQIGLTVSTPAGTAGGGATATITEANLGASLSGGFVPPVGQCSFYGTDGTTELLLAKGTYTIQYVA